MYISIVKQMFVSTGSIKEDKPSN